MIITQIGKQLTYHREFETCPTLVFILSFSYISFAAGIWRNLVRECGKGIKMKESVSMRMTGHVIVNLEKRGAAVEIVARHWTGTKKEEGRGIVGVTVITAAMIEISTGIMTAAMIEERGDMGTHVTPTQIMAGTTTKVMSMQATDIKVACMRGVHTTMVSLGMKEIWLVPVRIVAPLSNAKVVMVKMILDMKPSTQSDVSMGTVGKICTVRWHTATKQDLSAQNLEPWRKVRHKSNFIEL